MCSKIFYERVCGWSLIWKLCSKVKDWVQSQSRTCTRRCPPRTASMTWTFGQGWTDWHKILKDPENVEVFKNAPHKVAFDLISKFGLDMAWNQCQLYKWHRFFQWRTTNRQWWTTATNRQGTNVSTFNVNIAGVTFGSTETFHIQCLRQNFSSSTTNNKDRKLPIQFTCQIFWEAARHPPTQTWPPTLLLAAPHPPQQSSPKHPGRQHPGFLQKWPWLEPHEEGPIRSEQTHCWWNVRPCKIQR